MPWNCRRWKYFGQKAAKRCYKFSEEISWNFYSKCSTQTFKDIKEKTTIALLKIFYAFLVRYVMIGISFAGKFSNAFHRQTHGREALGKIQ